MKQINVSYAWDGSEGPVYKTKWEAMQKRPSTRTPLFKILHAGDEIIRSEEEPTREHHGDGDE